VVTPSFNQGQFVEETIRSILLQGYPHLEHFVLDGGSTDNSVDIIKKYAPWLTRWASEPDGGQSAAINRGLGMGSGLFATWINSDDLLCKNALVSQVTSIGFAANVVYVGICRVIDVTGKVISSHRGSIHSLEDLLRIGTVWRSGRLIDQPAVLFPLRLALTVGGLDNDNHNTMDYELWGRFFLAGAHFQYTDIPIGMFRIYPGQKTSDGLRQTESLLATARKLATVAEGLPQNTKEAILAELHVYHDVYQKDSWRSSGRLARIGLPPYVVIQLRSLKARLQNKTKTLFRPTAPEI